MMRRPAVPMIVGRPPSAVAGERRDDALAFEVRARKAPRPPQSVVQQLLREVLLATNVPLSEEDAELMLRRIQQRAREALAP